MLQSPPCCEDLPTPSFSGSVLPARSEKCAAICIYKLGRDIGWKNDPWLVLFQSIQE